MNRLLLLLAGFFVTLHLFAKEPDDSTKLLMDGLKLMDSIENTLHYKTGSIELSGGVATINVPENFKFLGSAEAKYVIETIWGNPPSDEAPLGILFPANTNATSYGGYAFIISYDAIGYVKDSDADKINYEDLLKDMKEGNTKENEERKKLGLSTMHLQGWAAKPYYDHDRKVLHWAKEYAVEGNDEHSLNYDIRVLGRKGMLTLQAVAGIRELDTVNSHIDEVLGMVSFNKGQQYQDFDSKTDDVAAWTIGGLVAGKMLAKVGFFAKFFKFILAGLVLVGGAIWRFITGRRKKEEEFVYQPQPAPDSNNPPNPTV